MPARVQISAMSSPFLFFFVRRARKKTNKKQKPTGGIEPPTFRLQSECSTTKLSRHTDKFVLAPPISTHRGHSRPPVPVQPKEHEGVTLCRCLRSPGIEPGSTAWKATMLTITPATLAPGLAQLVERWSHNPKVVSSILTPGNFAWMNSEGSGLGLQIQGGLTSQWFESTFCAFVCKLFVVVRV